MSAKELKEKYEADLAELQKLCPHYTATDWMEEQWAPAHGTGFQVRACEHCGFIVKRRKMNYE